MEKENTDNYLHVGQNLIQGNKQKYFSLHQIVIKRKEKQNKRNVKHDDEQMSFIFAR